MRSALPPVAVVVENEAIVQGRHVEEAQLLRRPWLQHVFLPVQVNEDLKHRPPRRPKGTAKAMIARGKLPVAGALYVVSFPFGPTYFRLPTGAKAGDTVYVKLPDVFDDGTVWGDNADMYCPLHLSKLGLLYRAHANSQRSPSARLRHNLSKVDLLAQRRR
jgi:hypothetical protein